ncbi:glycerate kinase type-2 family protein [Thermofilum pendens]|uniref:glycerate kinase type-2 family protein n=1 Tax=Thermofilum pendens TaxID=2269 RepID=UPI00069CB091|nr:glycerate kinase [Thermofilum pendens]
MSEASEHARMVAVTLALEGVAVADPAKAVENYVRLEGDELVLRDGTRVGLRGRVIVVGAGKATGGMAVGIEKVLGDRISGGVISVPEDLVESVSKQLSRIQVVGATHPRASRKSVEAGERIVSTVRGLREEDTVIALFSGGGSALAELPAEGVDIEELGELSVKLMKAGADIVELNTVRKHLSRFKGGWLAKHAYPAAVVALLISDVVGDRMDTIASGPTVPDPTTYQDAVAVIRKYRLEDSLPQSIRRILEDGLKGLAPETPKPGDPAFSRVHNRIIASNTLSLNAMAEKAKAMGYNTVILTSLLEGEAREVAKVLAAIAKEVLKTGNPVSPPAVILAGGETTVTVKGKGLGGRNQELALSAAIALKGVDRVALVSIGSDGRDGPTDVAGAVVDGYTYQRALAKGVRPEEYLENNDSYNFFRVVGGHVKTGYTGTNVNDFVVIVVEKENPWE